jgi:hypothetical protein
MFSHNLGKSLYIKTRPFKFHLKQHAKFVLVKENTAITYHRRWNVIHQNLSFIFHGFFSTALIIFSFCTLACMFSKYVFVCVQLFKNSRNRKRN